MRNFLAGIDCGELALFLRYKAKLAENRGVSPPNWLFCPGQTAGSLEVWLFYKQACSVEILRQAARNGFEKSIASNDLKIRKISNLLLRRILPY